LQSDKDTEFNQFAPTFDVAYSQPGLGNGGSCGIGEGVTGTFSCTQLFEALGQDGLFSSGPVSATSYNGTNISYSINAYDGQTATITSAEYFVTGVTPGTAPSETPEPASIALAIVGIGFMAFKIFPGRLRRSSVSMLS
jgi:hypothetical protein